MQKCNIYIKHNIKTQYLHSAHNICSFCLPVQVETQYLKGKNNKKTFFLLTNIYSFLINCSYIKIRVLSKIVFP